jgi:hypothetical protein
MNASYLASELGTIANVDGHPWEARRIHEAVILKGLHFWTGGVEGDGWSHGNGWRGGSRCNGRGEYERASLIKLMFPFTGRV